VARDPASVEGVDEMSETIILQSYQHSLELIGDERVARDSANAVTGPVGEREGRLDASEIVQDPISGYDDHPTAIGMLSGFEIAELVFNPG